MSFAQPWWLLLLLVVGVLAAGYWLIQRRRRRDVMRFTNLELLERVVPRRRGWPRHVPTALILVALALLTVRWPPHRGGQGAAQPGHRDDGHRRVASMQATDVAPTRLQAAQVAAKSFADRLTPASTSG